MKYQVQSLIKLVIHHTPITPIIQLIWAMQRHTLVPSKSKKEKKQSATFKTARQPSKCSILLLRTAVCLGTSRISIHDPYSDHDILSPGRTPTDNLMFTQMASGMSKRLGTESEPSRALTWGGGVCGIRNSVDIDLKWRLHFPQIMN
jgi:hypothetical protein